jgi:hypothetical protein
MAEIIEESYVKLEPGMPTVMRFDMYKWVQKAVIDPKLGFPKNVKTLAFHVIELDGRTVSTVYSVISGNLQKEFMPYLAGDKYLSYRFTIIKEGPVDIAPRIMLAVPI